MRRERAAELLRLARDDVGMSRDQLAVASDTSPDELELYESGAALPDADVMARLLRAADARPSLSLMVHRAEIEAAASRHHLHGVRVFGSTARGSDTSRSDIDLLVGTRDDTTLFDLAAFVDDVRDITGREVDVLTEHQAEDPFFAHVVAEAVPL